MSLLARLATASIVIPTAAVLRVSRPALCASMSTAKNPPDFRMALCQMKVSADKQENITNAKAALKKAADGKASLVVLPEVWNSPYSTASFGEYSEIVPSINESVNAQVSPSTAMLCGEAKAHNIWLIGGSIPERETSAEGHTRLYNTCVIVNPEGHIVAKHRKVHLFDIDVPGRITFKESDSLSPGDSVTVFDSPWGKIGVGICYDIRFPELAMIMRQRGCKLIVYPGAFNMVTGPAHWELLQRARAVDNQVYIAACSPARNEEGSGYLAWGHSSVISPWGDVIATIDGGEAGVVFADVEIAQADVMRENIPCWKQKRNDMYSVVDIRSKL